MSVFSSTVTDLVLIYESVTSSASIVHMLTFHSWTLNPTQLLSCLLNSVPTESINYVSSLYNFRTNQIVIIISNSSRYCVLIRCCGNVSSDPLLSNGCPSTVDSVTSGMCLLNHCLAMNVSVILLTVHLQHSDIKSQYIPWKMQPYKSLASSHR
jgi:hypothetical protein